jgi:hypothetical protein
MCKQLFKGINNARYYNINYYPQGEKGRKTKKGKHRNPLVSVLSIRKT